MKASNDLYVLRDNPVQNQIVPHQQTAKSLSNIVMQWSQLGIFQQLPCACIQITKKLVVCDLVFGGYKTPYVDKVAFRLCCPLQIRHLSRFMAVWRFGNDCFNVGKLTRPTGDTFLPSPTQVFDLGCFALSFNRPITQCFTYGLAGGAIFPVFERLFVPCLSCHGSRQI